MSRAGVLNAVVIGFLMLASAAMFVPLAMRALEKPYMFASTGDVPATDVALVLGASVFRGRPSPVLEERANTAVQLYLSGKVRKILVTGDNSALTHDEVTPVRKYLLAAGIPAGDIFLDHAGFDTYSSMYRARDVFQARSMTVVTQDFHLPRSMFIARELGLVAYGVGTEGGGGTGWDYIREVPASMKALLDLVIHRQPKYLGEKIPLTGDGSSTWY
ncbi:YdcF family protein [Candidatus Kaiserbacteria bacterium]|nr:YdcF family protein [Candidatus Kaiserbacteria bacterium]